MRTSIPENHHSELPEGKASPPANSRAVVPFESQSTSWFRIFGPWIPGALLLLVLGISAGNSATGGGCPMCALGSYVGSLFKGGEIEDTNSEFVKTLTAANYEEVVLHSDKPVLIDFHALWCGPCRAMSPIVSTLAMEKADSLVIAKINVDQEAQLAQQFNVSSIPTFIVVNKGKVVARTEGAVGRRGLDKLLAEIENK